MFIARFEENTETQITIRCAVIIECCFQPIRSERNIHPSKGLPFTKENLMLIFSCKSLVNDVECAGKFSLDTRPYDEKKSRWFLID